MASIVLAYIVMVYLVMADIVMAYMHADPEDFDATPLGKCAPAPTSLRTCLSFHASAHVRVHAHLHARVPGHTDERMRALVRTRALGAPRCGRTCSHARVFL